MRKYVFSVLLVFFSSTLFPATIQVSPGQVFVGTTVHFSLQTGGESASGIHWDFGDGNVQAGASSAIDHVFREPGNYHLVCTWEGGGTADSSIVVNDNRHVSIQGNRFVTGMSVRFNAENFVQNQLRWEFGDGAVENGGTNRRHAYPNPGAYTVKVFDFAGQSTTAITCSLNVEPENRSVNILTPNPAVYQGIEFTADNFSSGQLQWDFGDGTVQPGGNQAKHLYSSPGSFRVKVSETGADPLAVENTVVVGPDIRKIEFTPSAGIEVGATVTIRLVNGNTDTVDWRIGSDQANGSPPTLVHQFLDPGPIDIVCAVPNQPPLSTRIVVNDRRSLQISPQEVFAGSSVTFEAVRFVSPSLRWDFGDGRSESGGNRITHQYSGSGSYRVKVFDFDGQARIPVEIPIQVLTENREIVIPGDIIEGEAADIGLRNVSQGSFIWRFSNGESRNGNSAGGVRFLTAGQYQVTISDPSGKYPPLEKSLQVKSDVRSLKSSAPYALPVDEVTFTAAGFRGPSVKWNFGDGTVKADGLMVEKHTFGRAGTFKVTAIDFAGGSTKIFSQDIQVAEILPDFAITVLELTFDNGKYFRVIPKNNPSPVYQLRVKSKGRGILRGNLQLDDQSLGLFQMILYDNQPSSLERGQMVPLPVLDQGLHRLTVKFSNYSFGKPIPVIKYFVSLVEAIRILSPQPDSKVERKSEVRLQWESRRKNVLYEIAISEIPFQFVADDQIEWKKAGSGGEYALNLSRFKTGDWVYWQVREADSSGRAVNTSEITTFKIIEAK